MEVFVVSVNLETNYYAYGKVGPSWAVNRASCSILDPKLIFKIYTSLAAFDVTVSSISTTTVNVTAEGWGKEERRNISIFNQPLPPPPPFFPLEL